MTVTRYQIGRSPFKPLTSFLAYATGEEKVKLKDQMKQEGQRDERTGAESGGNLSGADGVARSP